MSSRQYRKTNKVRLDRLSAGLPKSIVKLACAALLAIAANAIGMLTSHAGGIELSGTGMYSKTKYSSTDYNKNTRLVGSIGYSFFTFSEIELSYQKATDRTFIANYQDITLRDEVYSANYMQNLLPQSSPIQPYAKGGVGRLHRKINGSYYNTPAPDRTINQLTVVLGAGMKIFLTRAFAIRGEATSYLQQGRIRSWKDNVSATVGITMHF